MALPLYLAMTAAEMGTNTVYPAHLGYMACHFSPYGTALCNMPSSLPIGAMLILNDRIPISGHNPTQITQQLHTLVETFKCRCILLDFQRPKTEEASELVNTIVMDLPCPVGVSHLYAKHLDCPVFLPPVPLDEPIAKYIIPWQGREIWLEVAQEGMLLSLTEGGCTASPLPYPSDTNGHIDHALHCHYTINLTSKQADFTLFRTEEDLQNLIKDAKTLGVTQAVGLWQELRGN